MLTETEAARRLLTWREVAAWQEYAAMEFVRDETTREYLLHVATCTRDEGERRYAEKAGLEPVLAG